MTTHYDAIIVGGGFYGASIALYLKEAWKFQNILIVEREDALLKRASYNNQARVHNGYHYPRSFTTAYRSRINLPRFVQEWPFVIKKDFTKIYAIARRNSKVTARQFSRFCQQIGASLHPVPSDIRSLFEPHLIEELFLAEEYSFDAKKLADWAKEELHNAKVETLFSSTVEGISKKGSDLCATLKDGTQVVGRYVFNCTYSGLNQLGGEFGSLQSALKQEIAEMALIDVPPVLKNLGITVMDGPFFSMMPFPDRNLHTLSHVRYTPHSFWFDKKGKDPYAHLEAYEKQTRVDRMIRDVRRYLPAISASSYRDSLFEIKTVLIKNEGDDGRPILFEKHPTLPRCYSILGGKIDNIYDVLLRLQDEHP
jgi:glycine/D-amino acid oxidase-like deaminating enzyme